ncbi:MAG: hypothetical protein R2769_10625 [Saprospiraceae bacterium]
MEDIEAEMERMRKEGLRF